MANLPTSKKWRHGQEKSLKVLEEAYTKAMSDDEDYAFNTTEAAEHHYRFGRMHPDIVKLVNRQSYNRIREMVKLLTDCGCSSKRVELSDAIKRLDGISAFKAATTGAGMMVNHAADGIKTVFYRRKTRKD